MPDSAPKWAGTISTAARDGGSARSATSSRAGSSSRSPAATAPPPITITCGLSAFTRLTRPAPRRRPISASAARAALVALVRQLGGDRSGDLGPRREPAARAPSRDAAGLALGLAADRACPKPAPPGSRGRDTRPGSRARRSPRPCARAPPRRPWRRGRCDRSAAGRRRCPCRAGPSRRDRARRPRRARCSASNATLASLSTCTGSPSRSLMRSRNGTPSSGRWVDHALDARLLLDQGRDPEAHRVHVRSRGADLLDGLDEDVERLLAVGAAPRPMHPVVDHERLVDDAAEQLRATRVDADYTPRRHGRTIYRGLVSDPPQGPSDPARPNTTSTGLAARRRPPVAAAAISTRCSKRLSRFREREPRRPGERRGITPGRVLKWLALAVAGWLLLSLVLFLVSAQTAGGRLGQRQARPRQRRQPALGQHDPRARIRRADGRLDRRVAAGPLARRHDHARPRRLRRRAQALHPARLVRRDPRATAARRSTPPTPSAGRR